MENKTEFVLGPIQERWLKSLEEHPERQTTGILGSKDESGNYQACCLGEYLICAGREVWVHGNLSNKNQDFHSLHGDWIELGLYSPNGAPRHSSLGITLAWLNDSGKTWPEIAAIIRQDPSVYLQKSL